MRGSVRGMCAGVLVVLFAVWMMASPMARAQSEEGKPAAKAGESTSQEGTAKEGAAKEGEKHEGGEEKEEPEPRTDFTIYAGSDFVRPGGLPRANLQFAIGHRFDWLLKNPLGSVLVFNYAYENAGTHGFFHTKFGSHSEDLGVMRDFRISKEHHISGYNLLQVGISTLTGDTVTNHFNFNENVGVKFHLNRFNAIWVQETYNKVVTVPWYTVTEIGYTYSIR
jgi:hypothetical protein